MNYEGSWSSLGDALIKSLNNPLIRANEYLRASIIGLFRRVTDLNHVPKLLNQYQQSGPAVRREVVLAVSAQSGSDWIRPYLSSLAEVDPWLRRAMLHAMRSLPERDRKPYARPVIATGDDLMTNTLLLVLDEAPHDKRPERLRHGQAPNFGIITAPV